LLLCKLSHKPRRILSIVFFASACWAIGVFAQDPNLLKSLPAYQPEKKITGTIRIWGNKHMQGTEKRWEEGFTKYHPDVRFETNLRGIKSAIGGLYTGSADIALTASDVWSVDTDAFEETFQYKPLAIEVSTGSRDSGRKLSPAERRHRDRRAEKAGMTRVGMTRCFLTLLAFFACTLQTASAQELDFLTGLEPYQPQQQVTGTIRSRGNNFTIGLMKLWEEGFLRLR